MFEVTLLNGMTFKIGFRYGTCEDSMGRIHRTTTAFVKDGMNGEAYTVSCSHLDKFSKLAGRKNALAGLLKKIMLNKEGRTSVWLAFRGIKFEKGVR